MSNYQTQPLERAARVLRAETIREVLNCSNLNYRGWNILDRWAVNQPRELKALENGSGITRFLMTVLEQQAREQTMLDHYETGQMLQQGLTEAEVLTLTGVQTRLN